MSCFHEKNCSATKNAPRVRTTLTCFYANVRSLVKNSLHIDLILSRFFDIYVFTETWLKKCHTIPLLLSGISADYQVIRRDRSKKAGGGVAILLKKALGFLEIFSESAPNSYEILSVDVILEGHKIRIVAVYRTPSCSTFHSHQLSKAVSDLLVCNYPSIVLGDFNYPDIDWINLEKPLPSSSGDFVDMVRSHNLEQLVKEPTRRGHILDILLTNYSSLVENVSVEPPIGMSDHNSFSFSICCTYVEHSYTYYRHFGRCDYGKICEYLASVAWRQFLDSVPTIDEKYELFLSIIGDAVEKFVPWCRTKPMYAYLPAYLQNMMDHRACLFRLATMTQAEHDWKKFHEFSEKFHKRLQKYNSHIEKKIIETGNKEKFYKFLRKKLRDTSVIGSLKSGDSLVVTDEAKADILADKFCEVFIDDNGICPDYSPVIHQSMSAFPWFDSVNLFRIIQSWPNSSSLTPDLLPTTFVKKIAPAVVQPLSYLYNQSLMWGEVPRKWKHSFVTPLLKRKPASDAGNYRPVSITSFFCRIFEKVLKDHIMCHLRRNSAIPRSQHGFMPGRSVESNMLESLNDWTEIMDNKKACDVMYFDFSKAFDRVSHAKLVYKVAKLGVHPVICRWLKSFLEGRTFQVKIGESFSSSRVVRSGVPQGGVLSPLLFIIYTSDIPALLDGNGVVVKQFADDLKLYKEVVTQQDRAALQFGSDLLYNWSLQWQLPLAPEKTVCMRLGKSDVPCEYTVGEHCISKVTSVRDLGFHYNDKLDFAEHCGLISRSALGKTYQIFKALSTRNKDVLLKAYKTYVRPIVESATTVFAPHKKKYIVQIEKVQNNFTRKLLLRTGSFLYSRVPRAQIRNKYLRLNTLQSRRRLRDVCVVFKMLAGIIDIDNSKFFSFIPSKTRGSSEKISCEKPRTNLRLNYFTCRALSCYLTLKHDVPLTASSFRLFKRFAEIKFLKH